MMIKLPFHSERTLLLIMVALLQSCTQSGDKMPTTNEPINHVDDAPSVVWHKGYGTDNGEHIHEVMQTHDGGYLGIGQMTEENEKGSDILVIKIDEAGEFLWQKQIGEEGRYDTGIAIHEVEDGYLIGGSIAKSDQERYLAKLDFEGKIIWEKIYPAPGEDMIRGLASAANGDILLTGYIGLRDVGFIFIADDSEGFVMRVNHMGDLIWDKPLSVSQGAKIRKTSDGYIICTTHYMNNPDHPQDMHLIKLDEDGHEIWAKNFGGDSDEHCYDCVVTADGGTILGGHSRSPSYGLVNWDFLIMKIDRDGNEEWHNTFGQPRGYDARYIHDEAYGVRQTPDGGFVIVGGTGDEHEYSASGHSKGPSDIWQAYAVKVDELGEKVWEGVYGSRNAHNAGEYLGLTKDGGFIIGTDSDTAGADKFDSNNFGFLKIK